MVNSEANNHIIGTIRRVALVDFLTYDEAVFKPGKNLNIIIGPNGTGKSTIVAGIILGCGGKPSVLSRSKDITEYIKNGKTKAHIEIELVKNKNGASITFHRSFDKNGKEIFTIEGNKVTSKAYVEKIQSFNIQVDNLCMFLPQDRVQDFTKLNAQEILHNTQISVCSQEINDAFENLKIKREKQKNFAKQNANLQIQLEDNINRNEQLHGMIENGRLRDRLAANIEMLKKKKAWQEYNECKLKYDEADSDVKKLRESIKKKNSSLKPLEKRQSEIAGMKNDLKNAISKAETKINQTLDEIEKMSEASINLKSEYGKYKQAFKNSIARASSHQKELQDLSLLVVLLKKEYEEAKTELNVEGDYEEKIKEFDDSIVNLKDQIDAIMQKVQDLNSTIDQQIIPRINLSKRKIEIIKDTQTKQFDVLRNNFEDAYRAYEWLQTHRNRFQGTIYNPIMTEIKVKDQRFAKYLENTVAVRDLEMFLCTNKEDMEKLMQKLRNEMNLKVNIGFTEETDEILYQPEIPIEDFNENLGLYTYLIDVIEGPAPVLNFLCALYNIQNVPIGDERANEYASRLPNHIQVFFSTDQRFNAVISKFSNKKSVTCTDIQSRNLLNTGIDQNLIDRELEKIEKLKQDGELIKEKRNELGQQIKQLEGKLVEIRKQKNELQTKIARVSSRLDKVKRKEVELEKMKNSKIDIPTERQKLKDNVDKIISSIGTNNANAIKVFELYRNSVVEKALADQKLKFFNASTGNVDEQIDTLKREIARIEETIKRASYVYEDLKKRMDAKEREALELTDGVPPTSDRFKYRNKFSKLPNNIEELQDKIDEAQGRIECIRSVDPHVLAEYEERKETIEELKHQLATEQERANALEDEIQNLHQIWYPEIQKVVSSINRNFSDFFAKMGFVGEIELIRKEERDYADYGIQIRVQYRDNEKLEALNRHVQSGGERAVAIAVYTLSLQHLTMVPFRCVDEINQGMDPKNERKIFQMLVDITCQPGQSQYFFVTPKLLPDLPYHDLMTVSIVHNGKYVSDPHVFYPPENKQNNVESDESMDENEDDEDDD
ncbi:hypothetical protein PVAND_008532 [Polypedilum vanderplanki]|uniref:Structural maintenance of chromosomes protein 5 n=1 Tax=Polypedilum vanderplanki TaxID=319348 RepID=A0A9J6C9U3_POLVA|nr:hypothetical protein PVAND_008532 [Polypedilum vanderplanki]